MALEVAIQVAERVLSAIANVRHVFGGRKPQGEPRGLPRRVIQTPRPQELELVPISFEIDLAARVPRIEVELRAVNYLSRALQLESVRAALSVGGSHASSNWSLSRRSRFGARTRAKSIVGGISLTARYAY
jgi:hypothetical protein